ncbi:hypothetical protein BY458DRAFT_445086, partial [Sporodiniella umbellata]
QIQTSSVNEIYHLLKVIQDRPKRHKETPQKQHMFQSLTSEPSPQRLTYFQSPVRECHPHQFIWSPTHPSISSTPLRTSMLKQQQKEDEEQDEFGFSDLGDVDLAMLEDLEE